MFSDKFEKMTDDEFRSLTDEEFNEYIKLKKEDLPRHHRKIEEITIDVVSTPEEAIEIAKSTIKYMNWMGQLMSK